jgi:hypothetical protein
MKRQVSLDTHQARVANPDSASPLDHPHAEMRRRCTRTSFEQQESKTYFSSSLPALLNGASTTHNERLEPEEDSPTTSFGIPDLPASNPSEDSRLFQFEHCDNSYAHNKIFIVGFFLSGYSYHEMLTKRHNKTSKGARARLVDGIYDAIFSPVSMTASEADVSARPTSVKLYKCPCCRREYDYKFPTQVRLLRRPCQLFTDSYCSAIQRRLAGKYAMSVAHLGMITAMPMNPIGQTNPCVRHAMRKETSPRS